MEVHPPHEPVHSWRDALIHIGLMTIGLFIALMLEGLVESSHHRHLVREARENIRVELEQNRKAAHTDIADLDKEQASVEANIDALRRIQAHPEKGGTTNFTWSYTQLSDAAWRSARDTGALGYMSYETVQGLSNVYGEQALLVERMRNTQFHEAEIVAPMAVTKKGQALPEAEFDAMITDAARTQWDLQVLGQLLKGLDQQYDEELKKL